MDAPDYDSPWKDLLDDYFEPFMEFFFPAAHAQIDWARGVELLDKELQKITADAALGRRTVDKLVKVWLKSGENIVALIHGEVQGAREADFAERIYVYHHRISDRFNERVATFVVLTDKHRRWRPREYKYELLGTRLSLRFASVKLLDWQGREAELEKSTNIFALVVQAHLRLLETARDPQQRLQWKLVLTKMLYERGYTRREIVDLYKFLDWLIFLPQDFQQAYKTEMYRFEEGRKMPYLSLIEREGIAKGLQQGMQQTSERFVLRYLTKEIGELDAATTATIKQLPLERLTTLSDEMFDFKTASDLAAWLQQHAAQETALAH
jgi:hypothetical protein